MAWLWKSWEEFVHHVQPVGIQRGRFQHSVRATELDLVTDMVEAVEQLTDANDALIALGFDGKNGTHAKSQTPNHEVHELAIRAVYAGETLLLHHKRLALSDASDGFLHSHDILNHWQRYESETRIAWEIFRFTKDVEDLLNGFEHLKKQDEKLLTDGLELPDELVYDFHLARNVFSIGLDEVGLFLAGRGMEKLLRQIARDRKIALVVGNKKKPAEDVEFYNLIETMSRVGWKTRKLPLIAKETKALLHYLRELRNRGAHKGESVEGAREKATVIATTAMQLWSSVNGNRARLYPLVVTKDWQ